MLVMERRDLFSFYYCCDLHYWSFSLNAGMRTTTRSNTTESSKITTKSVLHNEHLIFRHRDAHPLFVKSYFVHLFDSMKSNLNSLIVC